MGFARTEEARQGQAFFSRMGTNYRYDEINHLKLAEASFSKGVISDAYVLYPMILPDQDSDSAELNLAEPFSG